MTGAKQTPQSKCKLCGKSYARPNNGDPGLQPYMEEARKEEPDAGHKKIDDRAARQQNCLLGALMPASAAARDSDASECAPKRHRAGNMDDFDNTGNMLRQKPVELPLLRNGRSPNSICEEYTAQREAAEPGQA